MEVPFGDVHLGLIPKNVKSAPSFRGGTRKFRAFGSWVTINRWALAPVFGLVTAANAVRLIKSKSRQGFRASLKDVETLDAFRYEESETLHAFRYEESETLDAFRYEESETLDAFRYQGIYN